MPLLNHLRQPHSLLGKSPKGAAGGSPPSFYEADQDKWRRKFAQSVLERTQFKKKYLSDRKTSVLNQNDNLLLNDETDWDQKLKKTHYTGGQLIPTKSEFKQVLKRRKSRQSTDMPSQVDFEYQGNSAGHLNTIVQNHNLHQINFELNLRQYKNQGSFKGEAPFLYPKHSAFAPQVTMREYYDKAAGTNYNTKMNPFLDRFAEPNTNAILHTLGPITPTVYRNAEWMADLRGDRSERVTLRLKNSKRSPQRGGSPKRP